MTTRYLSLKTRQVLFVLLFLGTIVDTVLSLATLGVKTRKSLDGFIRQRQSTSKPQSVEVCLAEFPRDLEMIQECRMKAFHQEPQQNKPIQMLRSQKSFVNADSAVSGHSACLVAKEQARPNRIMGTADIATKKDGTMLLQNVFVRPEARGQGLAQRLVDEAEKYCLSLSTHQQQKQKQQPVFSYGGVGEGSKLSLDVDTGNKPAIGLYKKLGYTPNTIVDSALYELSLLMGANLRIKMAKELSSSTTIQESKNNNQFESFLSLSKFKIGFVEV